MKLFNRSQRRDEEKYNLTGINTWPISKRLTVSFASITVITLIIGLFGFGGAKLLTNSIYNVAHIRMPSIISLLGANLEAEHINTAMQSLVTPGETFEKRDEYYHIIEESLNESSKKINEYDALPRSEEEDVLWVQFIEANDSYKSEIDAFLELAHQFDELGIDDPIDLSRRIESFTEDHYKVVQKVLHMIHVDNKVFDGSEDHTTCGAGSYLPVLKTENIEMQNLIRNFSSSHQAFHQAVVALKSQARSGQYEAAQQNYKDDFLPSMNNVFKSFDSMLTISNQASELMHISREHIQTEYTPAKDVKTALMNEITTLNNEYATLDVENANSNASIIQSISLFGIILSVGIAVFLGYLAKKSINKALTSVIERLGYGAEQINVASDELSGSAQSLASSASEQAANIQQTTSSVEEISSQSKLTSINSSEAATAMREAEPFLEQGVQAMERMNEAMKQIQESSLETSKVISTIDNIAFQTNLLALNAAVEAARAGDAGKGFAVVAEEVRNLAQRSSDAAKSTSELIHSSQQTSENGNAVALEVTENLHKIEESVKSVSILVSEIAEAAQEQQTGIEEMTKSMHHMDKVVQNNASNSEESASSAEELSSQAKELNIIVEELQLLVGSKSLTGNTVYSPEMNFSNSLNGSSHPRNSVHSVSFTESNNRDFNLNTSIDDTELYEAVENS